MFKMLEGSSKETARGNQRPFVIVLPEELADNVAGYVEIPKISENFATDPHAAVLKYLHRVHPDGAKLIFRKLEGRKGGIESLAFELPEVVDFKSRRKISNPDEARQAMENTLAYDIASCYSKEPSVEQIFKYLDNAREILSNFEKATQQ